MKNAAKNSDRDASGSCRGEAGGQTPAMLKSTPWAAVGRAYFALLGVGSIFFAEAALRADIYTARREGATIVPEHSVAVSMDAEDVVLQPGEYGILVTATFVMRNQSDQQVDSVVAFPLVGSSFRLDSGFKVEIRSGANENAPFVSAKTQVKTGAVGKPHDDTYAGVPPKKLADFPESVIWDVTWAPGETKIIRVVFDMGEPMWLSGANNLVDGWEAMYIVSTGALWKGPIGRADISIHFVEGGLGWRWKLEPKWECSYPEHATWKGTESVTWHFENWTPKEEIWLRSLKWIGLKADTVSDYQYALPDDYLGNKIAYTSQRIESLVDRELELARQYFPEKVKALDVRLLKIVVADWLLHEIYARHGDPFYLGKQAKGGKLEEGTVGDTKGNLYHVWQMNFMGYGYHGGWYHCDFRPEGAVKTASLPEQERKNAEFLKAYLVELRKIVPPVPQRSGGYIHVHYPGSE